MEVVAIVFCLFVNRYCIYLRYEKFSSAYDQGERLTILVNSCIEKFYGIGKKKYLVMRDKKNGRRKDVNKKFPSE